MSTNTPAIQWASAALNDINDMVNFISQFNPSAAASLVEAILASVERLANFPKSYRGGRVDGTREMPVKSYVVVYSEDENEINILRVMHSSRQWP